MSSSIELLDIPFNINFTNETTVLSLDNTINKKTISNSTDIMEADAIFLGVNLEGWSTDTRLISYLGVDDFTYDIEKVTFVYK